MKMKNLTGELTCSPPRERREGLIPGTGRVPALPRRATGRTSSGRNYCALLALVSLLAGCSIPIPQAEGDPTRFYVLSTTSEPATAPGPDAPAIHLREVEVATYLRSRPIIVRRGDHEIEFREFARWGEALELGIGRVLREELLARGAAGAVLTPGLRAPNVNYDRELRVRVLASEGSRDGAVNFRAVWELTTVGPKPESVARGDFRAANLKWDGQSEAQLVARLSEAIAGLAAEISGALKR
jgi:uncharacterized lipoprotein YmbA